MNPELRQTLQSISRNLEVANEAAQENIYTFTRSYIDPCLSGLKSCLVDCTAPCFLGREEQLRRKRGRSRAREELNFDFYDDWDDVNDPGQSLLGWRNDDLDRVLAGNQASYGKQPQRQRGMSYGSRNRRTTNLVPSDEEVDPTVIPSSSYLGFLERLPWKIGSKELRYKPSAADLQENPGGVRVRDVESEPLLEASDEGGGQGRQARHGRKRSETSASRSTIHSLSSRGDLIPSDEEDDAVPLDDEFAMMLNRRTTNTGSEDHSSGKTSSRNRPGVSRTSTRTVSSQSTKSGGNSRRSSSRKSVEAFEPVVTDPIDRPRLNDLKKEEEQARIEEESDVEKRREAAQKLAMTRGLSSPHADVIDTDLLS